MVSSPSPWVRGRDHIVACGKGIELFNLSRNLRLQVAAAPRDSGARQASARFGHSCCTALQAATLENDTQAHGRTPKCEANCRTSNVHITLLSPPTPV